MTGGEPPQNSDVNAVDEGTVLQPYPGMRPFREDEALVFFGRDDHRRALLRRMAATSFVAVIGTSGSGKSSLINAGLIPDLYSGYLPGTGSDWIVVVMEPGTDPLGRLALAFAQHEWTISTNDLRINSRTIVDAARARLGKGQRLLLLVDQCEELFRLTTRDNQIADHDEKASFIRLLLETGAQTPESRGREAGQDRIHVVMAMRSEFLGRASQFHGLPEAIDQGQYLIPRLSREQLRKAIEAPVGVARGTIEAALVQRVLNDLGDDQDQLPVLQHALQRTWAASTGGRMTVAGYEAVGSMQSALSWELSEALKEAERSLGTDGQRIVKRLFQSLRENDVTGHQVRRPTTARDLCEIADCTLAQLTAVLEPFRTRSFVRPYLGGIDESTLIDVSHEALLRRWTLLTQWIAEDEADARSYLRIARRAAEESGSSKPQYFTKPVLPELNDFWNRRRPRLAWAMRRHPGDTAVFGNAQQFLRDSVENEARLDREQRKRDEQAARRPMYFAGGLLLLLSIVGFVGQAFYSRSQQKEALETLVLATTASGLPSDRTDLRLQLAAELFARAPESGRSGLVQAITRAAPPLETIDLPAASIALSRSGDVLFRVTKEGQLQARNRTTGTVVFDVRLPTPVPDGWEPVVLTAGTKLVVVADRVTVWNAADGRLLKTAAISDPILWSASEFTAAFVEQTGAVAVCALSDDCGRVQRYTLPSAVVQDLIVSDDSPHLGLAVTSEPDHRPELRLLTLDPWKEIARQPVSRHKPLAMALDGTGLRVCWPDTLSIFTRDLNRETALPLAPAAGCALSPSQVATAHDDGSVRVWEILNDQLTLMSTVRSASGAQKYMALATPILAVSGDMLRTWNVMPFGVKRRFATQALFEAQGKYVLSGSRLYDTETGAAIDTPVIAGTRPRLWGLDANATHAVFYDAANMVLASLPKVGAPIEKWRVRTSAPRATLPRSDGRFTVMKGEGTIVSVLDERGGELRKLDGVSSYAFVPGTDDLLVLRDDNTSAIWPMSGGSSRTVSLNDPDLTDVQFQVAAFSPDGTRLAVAQSGRPAPAGGPASLRRAAEVVVWRWPELRLEARLPHTADVRSIAFRTDSTALISVAFDKTVRVWDLKTNAEIAAIPVSGRATAAAFTPSGKAAVVGDAGLTVVPLDSALLRQEACARISSNITPLEWRELFGDEIKYRKTCPNRP